MVVMGRSLCPHRLLVLLVLSGSQYLHSGANEDTNATAHQPSRLVLNVVLPTNPAHGLESNVSSNDPITLPDLSGSHTQANKSKPEIMKPVTETLTVRGEEDVAIPPTKPLPPHFTLPPLLVMKPVAETLKVHGDDVPLTLPKFLPTQPLIVDNPATPFDPFHSIAVLGNTGTDDPERARLLTEHVCGEKGRCGQSHKSPWTCEIPFTQCHLCRCDDDCYRFGDCCHDKYNFTNIKPYLYPDSCVSAIIKPSVQVKEIRYIMVDKCLNDSVSGKPNVTESCEAASAETKPVYSAQTKFHYKNRFCAVCNDITETEPWLVKAECRTVLNYSRLHTSEDFFSEASANSACALVSIPPEGSEVRECAHGSPLVSECPADWDDQAVVRDCRKYRHPVSFMHAGTFKNVFCAKCNGVSLARPMFCSPDAAPFSYSLPYTTLNNRDLKETRMILPHLECPATEVFDTYQSKCRELFCPPGKVVNNHTCVDLLPSAEGSAYKLHYSLIPKDSRGVLLYVDDLDTLFTSYREHNSYIHEYMGIAFERTDINITSFRPGKLSGDHVTEGLRVFNITVKSRVVAGASVPRKQLEAMLMDFVRRGWAFYNKRTKSFEVFNAVWLPEPEDDFLATNAFTVGMFNYGNFITETKFFQTESSLDMPDEYTTSSDWYLTVNELMDCNLIELSPDEFEVRGENAIMERATGKLLMFGQYVYAGDAVRVCTNFTGQKVPVGPLPPETIQQAVDSKNATAAGHQNATSDGHQAEQPVTITCICLSLLCIFLTFITYLLSPHLHTLPSKNGMVFFVNLFCAQLALLLAITLSPVSPVVCDVTGAAFHYFWLTSFCWVLASSYLSYLLFTKPFNRNHATKLFLRFCLACQIVPLAVVSTYIVTHAIRVGNLGYDRIAIEEGVSFCFFSTKFGFFVSFVLPVGILVLFSIFFLVRVFCTISLKADPIWNDMDSDRNLPRSYRTVLVIMIATWTFASLAVTIEDIYLWYFFVMINFSVGGFVLYCFFPATKCREEKGKKYNPSVDDVTEKPAENPVSTPVHVTSHNTYM